jgi:aspartyl-tRNA(Asn)/glutamyl-tRNA(Gln) amidotransferase subunit A
MTGEPNDLTIRAAAGQLQRGELSAAQLVDATLDRIAAVEPLIHAFETVVGDEARLAAVERDRELADGRRRGPLHGIPVVIKDIIDTAGVRTTASSRIWADRVPVRDAAVVERLKAAGAILLGKTTTHEFAFGVTCPPTRTPWDLERVSGGSSGGSAAAVAARAATFAIGTDTGGSIRVPSANCGVVGTLGTYGRVSKRGVAPLSWSLDYVGPITRTVEDAALVLSVLAGHDPDDPTSLDEPKEDFSRELGAGAEGLRVGLPRQYFFDGVQEEIAMVVRAAIEQLARIGADVVEVDLPGLESAHSVQYGILGPEAASFHQAWLRDRGDLYQPDVRLRLESGLMAPATHYVNSIRRRSAIKAAMQSCFETNGLDVLVAPTLPTAAVFHDQETVDLPTFGTQAVIAAWVRHNCPFNLTGQPVLSVPCGFTGEGLPVGLQIAARPLGESTMFRMAHAYEESVPWRDRHPTGLVGRVSPMRSQEV